MMPEWEGCISEVASLIGRTKWHLSPRGRGVGLVLGQNKPRVTDFRWGIQSQMHTGGHI